MKKKETSQAGIADLWPTQSMELLKSLHILTQEGKLNQDSRRKLKQVQHLMQLITPYLDGVETIADLGAGKSYLGFILYDLWMQTKEETRLWAIEKRPELIERSEVLAAQSGFSRISFVQASIAEAMDAPDIPETLDAVMALHACDTATDEAIVFALRKQAKFIALVPCCQAEVATLLKDIPGRVSDELQPLWRHGIHRREFASHLTNVIRSLFLESKGYKVRVTELIGWEHAIKNEIIVAQKVQGANGAAERQLARLLERFPLPMRLLQGMPAQSTNLP